MRFLTRSFVHFHNDLACHPACLQRRPGVADVVKIELGRVHSHGDGQRIVEQPLIERPALINAAVIAGAKGIVIAGVGNGNMTKAALDAAAAVAKRGIVVVRSSRVATGQVGRDVEVDDDKLGFVASLGLNPQKSRVLLRLALMKTNSAQAIQHMFDTY